MKFQRSWKVMVPAAIAASVMALSGCGGSTGEAASDTKVKESEGQVTISFDFWGSDKRIKTSEAAIKDFEAANPNIKVELQYADWSGYWDKLATSIAGDNAPDVIQMDEQYLASYASNGSLLDLAQASDFVKWDGMDKSLADMGKIDGKQYAVPASFGTFAVLVNNDVLDKYGITLPDTSTWTWDDFLDVAKQVQEKSNGEAYGTMASPYIFPLQLWARQHGESLYKDGKVGISQDTLAAYLETPKTWYENGSSSAPDVWSETLAATQDTQPFYQGKQALTLAPTNQMAAAKNAMPDANLTIAPLPSDDQDVKWNYLKPGMYYAVSAKSQHPAEAAKLINYLVNDEKAYESIGVERGEPANNEIRKNLVSTLEGGQKITMEFDNSLEGTLGDAPEVTPNGANSAEKTLTRIMQDVAFGRVSAADGAKQFIDEVNTEISAA